MHGEALVGEHRLSEAVAVLERALPMFDGGPDPGNQPYAMWALARALHGLGKEPVRVRQLAQGARELFAKIGATQADSRDAVTQFIDGLSAPGASPTPAVRGGQTR